MSTKTNLQIHENGFISHTVQITWLPTISTGWGNGYVGVPEGHKLFGKHYNEVEVEIHGGLTYAKEETIDGVKYWVFGFDTCHAHDNPREENESYVIAETERLFNQLQAF